MTKYNRDVMTVENKLIKEIGEMKFSFKKLLKVIELDALMSYYNK